MSLDVTPALLDAAERGEVPDGDFVACVRDSLPYAWQVIETVAHDLQVGGPAYQSFVSPRGQLLNQSPALRDC